MRTESTRIRPALLLFCCFFAAQSAFLTLPPILPELAADLDVGISAAGQLQTLAGLCGGVTALAITFGGGDRSSPERLLARGLAAIAAGSVLSAVAPAFEILLVAEALLGAGMATVVTGGVAAVPAWSPADQQGKVLAWALLGQPGAWVLGMPVIGVVSHVDWRLAWVAVPLAATVAAACLLALGGPGTRDGTARSPQGTGVLAWRRREVLTWAGSELLAHAAWAGTLVYAGALLHDVYGLSLASVGLILGLVAIACFPAAIAARLRVARHARSLSLWLAIAAAVVVVGVGCSHAGPAASAALLAALMGIAVARGLAGGALGLQIAPERGIEVSGLRAAAQQLGSLLGAGIGGAALAAGGWAGWSAAMGALFAVSTLPHLTMRLIGWGGRSGDAALGGAPA